MDYSITACTEYHSTASQTKTKTVMNYRICDNTTVVPFHHTEAWEQAECDPVHPPCD